MRNKLRLVAFLSAIGLAFAAGIVYAQSRARRLDPPPLAEKNLNAIEVLRVWAAPGAPQQVALRPVWKDPAAWGLLLVDIARHASRAYAADGMDEKQVLARIRAGFDAEWASPTDTPQTIKPR